jgi:hypothetical protein
MACHKQEVRENGHEYYIRVCEGQLQWHRQKSRKPPSSGLLSHTSFRPSGLMADQTTGQELILLSRSSV